MGKEIKAIETVYNGYRFRSRLEARWAVFFNDAEMPYEYEPEGFVLPNGECYLPDFYLPWFNMYVEIKRENLSDEEIAILQNKLYVFHDSYNKTHKDKICVGLFYGDPVKENILVCCDYHVGKKYDGHSSETVNWNRLDTGWFHGKFKKGCWFSEYSNNRGQIYGNGKRFITLNLLPNDYVYDQTIKYVTFHSGLCLEDDTRCVGMKETMLDSRLKGRQARFEYGECG